MKQAKFILLAIIVFTLEFATAQVAINKDGAAPHASAILDLSGSDGGFLLPRMLMEQRDSIADPAIGLLVYCIDCKELQIYNGEQWTNLLGGIAATNIPTVLNPATGREWMDRNLGASQVATSMDDADAFGDLFQWGRVADGHQERTSGITSLLSGEDEPGHPDFIISTAQPYDWKDPQNIDFWQGVTGINNPCPSGFRIPTESEWNAEKQTWSTTDAAGAFASVLKLPQGGSRNYLDGEVGYEGSLGFYWTSNIFIEYAKYVKLSSNVTIMGTNRGNGISVRCIKD